MTESKAPAVHPHVRELIEALRRSRITRQEFLRAVTLLGVSAAVAFRLGDRVLGVSSGAHAAEPMAPKTGGTLRCSMNVKDISDPAIYDWSEKSNVARHMVEPLVLVGADNIARPYLAERWEASPDLKTWTFYLRPGVVWSNGDSFTADDVVFNVRRWLDPATGSSNLGRFAAMTTTVNTGKTDPSGKPVTSTTMAEGAVEKIDDRTVRFNLSRPDLAMPENLADYTTLIVHRRFAEEGGDLVKNPVGTGPFRLTDFAVGEKAVLEKRQDRPWWGGDVYLDRIVYIDHGDDAAAQLAALASDQADCNFRSSIEQIDAIKAIPSLKLYQATTASCGVARMRVTEKPFDNKVLRQALQACVDHDELQRIIFRGFGAPGEDHHVAPIHPEYAPLPKQRQDYALARQRLNEAGFPDGLQLSIDCVANPTWEQNYCKALAEMLRPAGVTLAINVLPGATYWDRWKSTPFGFTSWAHRPLGVQTLNLAYRSGASWNESGYANPEFDRLLDEADALLDPVQRRAVMAKVEAILQEDAVILQSSWRPTFLTANQRVHGIAAHPAEEHHFNRVWLG